MKHTYITRAILKDYLTIKNVDITFNSGINIIIGKNGTGKTNFINYLADSLEFRPAMTNNSSSIYFSMLNQELRKDTDVSVFLDENLIRHENLSIKLYKDNEIINHDLTIIGLSKVKISHGIPSQYYLVNEPVSDVIRLTSEHGYSVFPNFIGRNNGSIIIFEIGSNYVKSVILGKKPEGFNSEIIFENLNDNLSRFTDVEKVRLGRNLIINDNNKKEIQFNNLYLEYFVNGEWLLFSQLSDGMKRLFYIISEITYSYNPIILLEEPELGIHPHQLYELMQFIKEKSEQFQFIITTHSPMVLNTLNSNELDSIIIAKIESGGTKLEHLTSGQIEKAKVFMQDLDLSDYWIHSDLED